MRDRIMVLTAFILSVALVAEKIPVIKTIDPNTEYFLYGVMCMIIAFAVLLLIRKAIKKWQDLSREFWMLEGRVNDIEAKQSKGKRKKYINPIR